VRDSNVQIISISEMYASVSVHFVSKGHITDSRTVTFSRFSTERYVSLLFNVYLCYVSLLFNVYWCYVSLLLNVYCVICLFCLMCIGVTCLCC
jgi:hypothetical protein